MTRRRRPEAESVSRGRQINKCSSVSNYFKNSSWLDDRRHRRPPCNPSNARTSQPFLVWRDPFETPSSSIEMLMHAVLDLYKLISACEWGICRRGTKIQLPLVLRVHHVRVLWMEVRPLELLEMQRWNPFDDDLAFYCFHMQMCVYGDQQICHSRHGWSFYSDCGRSLCPGESNTQCLLQISQSWICCPLTSFFVFPPLVNFLEDETTS